MILTLVVFWIMDFMGIDNKFVRFFNNKRE